jgi:anti-sigma factor RsiW
MMQKSDSFSPRDIERLSAYLDGDLPPQQVEALEARLRSEAELRRRLEELRHTIAQLRDMPPVRAPRNFTLTPEMAGLKPRRPPLFSFFRFASAVAAVALVVVIGLDLAVASGQLPSLSGVAGDMTEETALFNDAAQQAEAPAEAEADLGEPMAMRATEEQEEGLMDESGAASEAPQEEADDGAGDCADCPTPSFAGGELPATLEGRNGLSIEATATAKWEQTGQDEAAVDQDELALTEPEVERRNMWTPIRMVELGLAGLVLILVVTTLILRRQQL